MMRIHVFAAVLFKSGYTALANSPMVIDQLQIRSAGFTGCAVDANVITNVVGNPLILPRYGSLYVQSDDAHFNGYVADIDRFYASGRH